MIPDTRKGPLAQRLYRALASHLADHLGLCPIHGTRLICGACDYTWTGTTGGSLEADGLARRASETGGEMPSHGRCTRCGAEALCLDCYDAVDAPADAGLTPKEQARFRALLGHLVPKAGC